MTYAIQYEAVVESENGPMPCYGAAFGGDVSAALDRVKEILLLDFGSIEPIAINLILTKQLETIQ